MRTKANRNARWRKTILIGSPLYVLAQISVPVPTLQFLLGLAAPWLVIAIAYTADKSRFDIKQNRWVWVTLMAAVCVSHLAFLMPAFGDYVGGRTLRGSWSDSLLGHWLRSAGGEPNVVT